MFDGRAARQNRRARAFGRVRVNDGSQALGLGFAAGRIDLLHRGRHFSAVADAGGGEQLDQIGAGRLFLLHGGSDLFGCAAGDLH